MARLHAAVWENEPGEWIESWRETIAKDPHAPLLPLPAVAGNVVPA
jgi:membrane glycosyltransferase